MPIITVSIINSACTTSAFVAEQDLSVASDNRVLSVGLVERHNNWGLLAAVEHASAQVDAAACLLPLTAPGSASPAGHDDGVLCVSHLP